MTEKKVDEEWKKQAAEEKAQADREQAQQQGRAGPPPKPNFIMFLAGLATQALIHLGEMEHPITKKREKNLDEAKYTIDLIELLEEKTKGNLSAEEKKYLDGILYDLRMRFVAAAS